MNARTIKPQTKRTATPRAAGGPASKAKAAGVTAKVVIPDVVIPDEIMERRESSVWHELLLAREAALKSALGPGDFQQEDQQETLQRLAANTRRCGQLSSALQTYREAGEGESSRVLKLREITATSPRPSLWQLRFWKENDLRLDKVNIGCRIVDILDEPLAQYESERISLRELKSRLAGLSDCSDALEHYATELKKFNILDQTRPALNLLCRHRFFKKSRRDKEACVEDVLSQVQALLKTTAPDRNELSGALGKLKNLALAIDADFQSLTFENAVQELGQCSVHEDVVDEVDRGLNIPRLRSFARALCYDMELIGKEGVLPEMAIHLTTCRLPTEWVFISLHIPDAKRLSKQKWQDIAESLPSQDEGWNWIVRLTMELGGQAHLRWNGQSEGYKTATGVGTDPEKITWPENAGTGLSLMLCLPKEA